MEQFGKYGFLRRDYLKNHRNSTYQVMLLQDTIGEHLLEVDKAAREREDIIRDPYVLEFLRLSSNDDFYESDLEQALITHLQKFLLELGRGFSFVARQKRITFDGRHFRIDLVFYNYILKCFVLIDLKTNKLSYQDVGQMDMYVKMYDDLVRPDGHNPTIGILLCADTDEDVAHYSVLNNNDQLFAAKYLTYMPTQEELRREIEQQKEFFRLQNDG